MAKVKKIHIDVETFSSVDIRKSGAYKYCESIDFEILMVAYAFGDNPIKIIDLLSGETLPEEFIEALKDPNIEKHAHNANFERNAFRAIGYDVPIDQWYCSAIKSGYCGLPLSLGDVSKALNLEGLGKLSTGTALIRYFSIPCKPTKTNEGRHRNMPWHDPEKWEDFKTYCVGDVRAEREIGRRLSKYEIPTFERINYILDQEINDRGILIDLEMAAKAVNIDDQNSLIIADEIKEISGIDNPNSPAQLKKWLSEAMQKEIKSLAKAEIPILIKEAEAEEVRKVLKLRQKGSKTSIKKYIAMLNCACYDNRAHGLFQFYGGSRTGRWAGRLIQLQNLPQNHLDTLEKTREDFKGSDFETLRMLYDKISDTLSQLIRTAFVAKKGHTFAVADFSAIEARVIAWLAGETWRVDVFKSHGKIYEASAAMMFDMPMESIGKGSPERQKGKVAELALGYQGSVGALMQMGGEKMGLSEPEMKEIVRKWRDKSPNIVKLWASVDAAAKRAVKTRKRVVLAKYQNLAFDCDGESLTIELPSGRKLFYREPIIGENKWGHENVRYKGTDQKTRKWTYVSSYGGKFVENIVQAIARDLLALSMLRINDKGFKIVMHVHDEAVVETPIEDAEDDLRIIENIMAEEVPWAKDLPLNADGYVTPFYKKD